MTEKPAAFEGLETSRLVGGRGETDAMFLDAEYVDLTLRCEDAGFFPSPGIFECARIQRSHSKVPTEIYGHTVGVHHRPRGNRITESGGASPMMRFPMPSRCPVDRAFTVLSLLAGNVRADRPSAEAGDSTGLRKVKRVWNLCAIRSHGTPCHARNGETHAAMVEKIPQVS